MLTPKFRLIIIASTLALTGCTQGKFDAGKAIVVGAGIAQAITLDEKSVKKTATLAAKEYDGKHKVAGTNDAYSQRLFKMTNNLKNYDGLQLNFKVYKAADVNAFAMADGTVRVFTGLMDAMPDDQILAVIGHEIGHVKLKHSYHQMQTQLLTNATLQAAIGVGGVVGSLSSGQLGQLASGAVSAQFSQRDELSADVFAIKLLRDLGKDPRAMIRSIQTLKAKFGAGGGFMSSHPSNDERLSNLEQAIAQSN
ncbi:MAG: putative metalloprotease [Gammaproteobacteria bacterium]|jgi:putative metalloprotease